jgi:hypothetical protein
VSGWGCCPLACRHGNICVGQAVISLCSFMHVFPIALMLVRGFIVICCMFYEHGAHCQRFCLAIIVVVILLK